MLNKNLSAILIAGVSLVGVLPVTSVSAATVSVNLTETSEAFKNPMKGFRPSRYPNDGSFKDQEYATIYKHYIPYTNLENYANDPVQKIKDWCNTAWAGIESKNIKVIPRVVIYYPGTGEWWPDGVPHDGTAAQWASDALKNRLVAFASKLAQAWDNDPRVAAVEMGLWGKWGEHNIYPDMVPGTSSDRIPASFQSALGAAFNDAFKNKKVMVRYENSFTDFNFGYIWDSFALPDDAGWATWVSARNCWPTQMISGEVAYDWGNQSQLGGSPNGSLNSNSNTDYVISYIRSTHCSSLGWIAEYSPDGGTISANAARMQKEFGYRFVINSVSFPSRADAGSVMSVAFKVTNKGNAPFYYNWTLKANLLRADKSVAWSGAFDVDIRNWMPGNSYDLAGSFTLPAGLANGTYTLALTVNDPAGDLPSLRFANTNYYTGGFTPIGKVGVGLDASDQNLGAFDGVQNDATLHYSLNDSPRDTIAPIAPSNLVSTGKTDTTVSLAWDASMDNISVTGYEVFKDGALAASITGTSVMVKGLTASTAYTFTVKAKDAAGNSSNESNAVTVTTNTKVPGRDTIAPTAPSNLASTGKTETTVNLSWGASTDNIGVTGYEVYKSGTLAASVTGTSATVQGLTANTAYMFTVKAKDAAGNSSHESNAVTVTTDMKGGEADTSYEAETPDNAIAGGAAVENSASCSGGKKVGYIGNNSGILQFNNVHAPKSVNYSMTIYYLSAEKRNLTIRINGGAAQTVALGSSGGWDIVGHQTVTISLEVGDNTIEFSNATGWAPDIDRVTIKTSDETEAEVSYQSLETQHSSPRLVLANGQLRISMSAAGRHIPISIALFDCQGAQITRFAQTKGAGHTFTFDLHNTARGVYVVAIYDSSKRIIGRSVISYR